MSSRTLKILANARKAKCTESGGSKNIFDDLDNIEIFGMNESAVNMLDPENIIPPEYSFLCDDQMDDCDNDPDFNPTSSSDDSDEESIHPAKLKKKNDAENRQASPEKTKRSGLKNVLETHEKIEIVETQNVLRNIVVDLHINEIAHTNQQAQENMEIFETIKSREYQDQESITSTEIAVIADRSLETVQFIDAHSMTNFTNVQNQQDDANKENTLEEIEHDSNEYNDLDILGHDANEDNNMEKIEQKKKRHRSLENQMTNNKNKHPIRQPCNCKMKCCDKITAEDRVLINEEYWNMNRHLQRIWLSSKVTEELSKRKLQVGGRRNITRKYVLPKKNQDGEIIMVNVCQKFFLSTLGYGNANVLTSLRISLTDSNGNRRLVPRQDQRGRHPPPNKKNRNLIVAHINSYNPLPAHYAREHAPNRKYLPPDLTIKFMHNDYNSSHPDNKVCYEVYRQRVDQMNIGFYEATPEKCGFCQEMELNESEENQQRKAEHLLKVTQIREEYKNDQQIPYAEGRSFSADMQKVVLLPRMPDVKESFFTSRLITFNETFASMQKKMGRHNLILWHEGIAGRRAEDVASAFIVFLKLNRDANKIIIWMDNCTGQNKNFALYSSIICYINSPYCSTNEIILKYLVKGHTFMAADGLHGRIEQGMRKAKNIYDFNDFKLVCAKSSSRADVKVLDYSDFHKFENIIRCRKSNQGEESIPFFKDIVCAKFVRGLTDFTYQTSPGGDFLSTKNTLKRKAKLNMPNVMTTDRGISVNKKAKIVADLVSKMPANRKQFWVNLPENDTSVDLFNEGV